MRSRNNVAARPVRSAGPRVNATSRREPVAHASVSRVGGSRIGHSTRRIEHSPRVTRHHGHTYHSHIGYHYHPFYYGSCRYYVHCGRYYRWDPYWGYEWVPYPYGWYFSTLPYRCFPVYVGNVTYYYGQGTWFAPKDNGYEIVETPIAEDETLNVTELPYDCAAVVVNGKTYYVGEGTWFVATDNGYQVADAPTDDATIIETLPEDNKKVEVSNQEFFTSDGKWYMAVEGGYIQVEEPVAVQKVAEPEEVAPAKTEAKADSVPATRALVPAAKIELPADAKTVDVNGKKYYFANGTWYDKTVNGDYVIIESPLK